MKNKEKFKYIEHTADIQFQAFGSSIEEAFENSALAMFNAMSEGKVKETMKKKISVSGKDKEALLYNFLEELLFLFDSSGFFLSKINTIKIKNNKLTAIVSGDKADKYEIKLDVKAVTYNNMFVKKNKEGKYTIQVVLDV